MVATQRPGTWPYLVAATALYTAAVAATAVGAWLTRFHFVWHGRTRWLVASSAAAGWLLCVEITVREAYGAHRWPCAAHTIVAFVCVPAYALPFFLRTLNNYTWALSNKWVLARRAVEAAAYAGGTGGAFEGGGVAEDALAPRYWRAGWCRPVSRRRIAVFYAAATFVQAGVTTMVKHGGVVGLARDAGGACSLNDADFVVLGTLAVVYAALLVGCIGLLSRTNDAYLIRTEIGACFALWIALGTPFVILNTNADTYRRVNEGVFPVAALLVAMACGTHLATVGMPAWVALRAARRPHFAIVTALRFRGDGEEDPEDTDEQQLDDILDDREARDLLRNPPLGGAALDAALEAAARAGADDASGVEKSRAAITRYLDSIREGHAPLAGPADAGAPEVVWPQTVPPEYGEALECLRHEHVFRHFLAYLVLERSAGLLSMWADVGTWEDMPAGDTALGQARKRMYKHICLTYLLDTSSDVHVYRCTPGGVPVTAGGITRMLRVCGLVNPTTVDGVAAERNFDVQNVDAVYDDAAREGALDHLLLPLWTAMARAYGRFAASPEYVDFATYVCECLVTRAAAGNGGGAPSAADMARDLLHTMPAPGACSCSREPLMLVGVPRALMRGIRLGAARGAPAAGAGAADP